MTNLSNPQGRADFPLIKSEMIVSGHDYLFVREGQVLAGVICLLDIMGRICDTVRACRI
jgi:hypothetical protein